VSKPKTRTERIKRFIYAGTGSGLEESDSLGLSFLGGGGCKSGLSLKRSFEIELTGGFLSFRKAGVLL
jgi:hypothetical protein